MEDILYNRELNEFKIEILNTIKKELEEIKFFKVRKSSNAYLEIDRLVLNIDEKINSLSNHFKIDNTISTIKIENNVLDELFKLKRELETNTVSELLNLLVKNYNQLFLYENLTEIKEININENLKLQLNKMHFYICTNENNVRQKVLYKIDDIIISNNIRYLDMEEFKEYFVGNDVFNISPTFTLKDIDLFLTIWKNTSYIKNS